MRPFHRIPLWLRIFAVACLVLCSAAPSPPQSAQLPVVWNDAVHALAERLAAALGPSREFSVDVNEIASAPVDPALVRDASIQELILRGGRLANVSQNGPAESMIQITISKSLDSFALVATIHRGDSQSAFVVTVGSVETSPSQPVPQPTLARKIVWQQEHPILDFAQASLDASHTILYLLEPSRISAYQLAGDQLIQHESSAISQLYPSRDTRGRLTVTDATHVSAVVGGIYCDASWSAGFTIDCRENAGQQWPMGNAIWQIDPSRDYFLGSVLYSNSVTLKFPSFYSAATPPPAVGGPLASQWIVAGTDGRSQLFTGAAESIATFDNWGSDIASIASSCSSNWQLLVTGAGDWTQPDQIQLYSVTDGRPAPAGQPLEIPGPVLALWSSDDAQSVRAISRNLQTGLYEASIVSVSCSH